MIVFGRYKMSQNEICVTITAIAGAVCALQVWKAELFIIVCKSDDYACVTFALGESGGNCWLVLRDNCVITWVCKIRIMFEWC
jgi:hypothetical protein